MAILSPQTACQQAGTCVNVGASTVLCGRPTGVEFTESAAVFEFDSDRVEVWASEMRRRLDSFERDRDNASRSKDVTNSNISRTQSELYSLKHEPARLRNHARNRSPAQDRDGIYLQTRGLQANREKHSPRQAAGLDGYGVGVFILS